MKTILKILLAALVLSLVPLTHVCAQPKIKIPSIRKVNKNRFLEGEAAYIEENRGGYNEGLATFKDKNGKYGFIDETGKVVIPCIWKKTNMFHEGLASVQDQNDKWGFVDKTGKLHIPCRWKNVWYFKDGMTWVEDDNNKRGFIDKMGNLIIPCKWDDAGLFHDGLAAVRENGKYGYVDKTGKIVIPLKWNMAHDFFLGRANVWDSDGVKHSIDKTGKIIE